MNRAAEIERRTRFAWGERSNHFEASAFMEDNFIIVVDVVVALHVDVIHGPFMRPRHAAGGHLNTDPGHAGRRPCLRLV